MEYELIKLETAKLAKECFFNQKCSFFYDGRNGFHITETKNGLICNHDLSVGFAIPSQSILQRWIREEHNLIILVVYVYECDNTPYSYVIYKSQNATPINKWIYDFKNYEEALEKGLQECLMLIL